MEGHIVLAHKLHIAHVRSAFIGAPPALPVGAFTGIHPFAGGGDIFNWCVKPDVENFALHSRPGRIAAPDGNAPIKVAGNAAVLQSITVIEPFFRDGRGQHRPIGFLRNPITELLAQRGLPQIQVACVAHFEVGRARYGRARLNEIGWLQLFRAIFALIAARFVIAAVGAGAFDITIWQKAPVRVGIHLLLIDLGN